MESASSEKPKPVAGGRRRRNVRYRLAAPGLVADATGFHDCVVADISVGGAMLEGELALPIGSEIALGFDSLMGILGTVAHQGDGFVGVKFHGGDAQRQAIVAWIRERYRDARAEDRS